MMDVPNTLNRIISWLEKRPVINFFFALTYFIFILLMHNPLVQVSIWVEMHLSIETYNLVIEGIFVAVVLLLIVSLTKKFRINFQNLKLEFTYLSLTLLLIIIHSRFMFDSNIEVIHSLEFTFLVFLLFPFTKRFGAAIFCTLPFMLIDEWYQYTVLYPQALDYLDLNDIMMDTYGCGLAMSLLLTFGLIGSERIKPIWKRTEFYGLIGIVLLVLIAVALCLVAPYQSDACSNTLLILNKRMTSEPFLRPHPAHHILFHVMKPTEALIAITTLFLFYFGLDSFRKTSSAEIGQTNARKEQLTDKF